MTTKAKADDTGDKTASVKGSPPGDLADTTVEYSPGPGTAVIIDTTTKTTTTATTATTATTDPSGETATEAALPRMRPGHTAAGKERERRQAAGECIVDDGTVHVGGAVNGVICSAHAMRYRPDGTPRG